MTNNFEHYYAYINLGGLKIEGKCIKWACEEPNGVIKLVVDDKEYVTSINNVLLVRIKKTNN